MLEPVGYIKLIKELLTTISKRGKRLDEKVVNGLRIQKDLIADLAVIVGKSQSSEYDFRVKASDRLHKIEERLENIENNINKG